MLEDIEQDIELEIDAGTFMEAIKQEFITYPFRFKNTDKFINENLKFLAIASYESLMLCRHWYLMRDDNLNAYYSKIYDFIDSLGKIIAIDNDEENTYKNFMKM